jgi:hypothetical protein
MPPRAQAASTWCARESDIEQRGEKNGPRHRVCPLFFSSPSTIPLLLSCDEVQALRQEQAGGHHIQAACEALAEETTSTDDCTKLVDVAIAHTPSAYGRQLLLERLVPRLEQITQHRVDKFVHAVVRRLEGDEVLLMLAHLRVNITWWARYNFAITNADAVATLVQTLIESLFQQLASTGSLSVKLLTNKVFPKHNPNKRAQIPDYMARLSEPSLAVMSRAWDAGLALAFAHHQAHLDQVAPLLQAHCPLASVLLPLVLAYL